MVVLPVRYGTTASKDGEWRWNSSRLRRVRDECERSSLVPRYRVDVFEAGLSAEHSGNGINASQADPLQQPHSRQVPVIRNGNDLRHSGPVEDEADGFPHGLGSKPDSLSRHAQREADLRRLSIGGDTDSYVANQDIGAAVRDAELHPPSLGKQRDMAHVVDELQGLRVRLRLPALVQPDLCVVPIHLKRWKICGLHTPQHDTGAASRKWIA